MVPDSLPYGGDSLLTLVHDSPSTWLSTASMMSLLDREGPGAGAAAASVAAAPLEPALPAPPAGLALPADGQERVQSGLDAEPVKD